MKIPWGLQKVDRRRIGFDMDELNHFFSNFNLTIKFTSRISAKSMNFLDITVNIHFHILTTTKTNDNHIYLLYTSAYPHFCKYAIPCYQLLRLHLGRLCSDISDFTDTFCARDYRELILWETLRKISSITCTEASNPTLPLIKPNGSSHSAPIMLLFSK